MNWSVFQASIAGPSHLERGISCQDACEAWTAGELLVVAVADGAGSASHSELGAALCVRSVVQGLQTCITTSLGAGEDALTASRSHLLGVVSEARSKMTELAATQGLAVGDLACTLVGVVARSPGVGYFFHVGDGLAIAAFEDPAIPPVVSAPQNGEYSNETWFVTHDDWIEHLRITPFEHSAWMIGVMTDGPMPFVMGRGCAQFATGFIKPISDYLRKCAQEEGNAGLLSILGSERTRVITDDDKTLVLAFPAR